MEELEDDGPEEAPAPSEDMNWVRLVPAEPSPDMPLRAIVAEFTGWVTIA